MPENPCTPGAFGPHSESLRFCLAPQEKDALRTLARLAIANRLFPEQAVDLPEAPGGVLSRPCGAFVTLKAGGHLRGCIGNVPRRTMWDTVAAMPRPPPSRTRASLLWARRSSRGWTLKSPCSRP